MTVPSTQMMCLTILRHRAESPESGGEGFFLSSFIIAPRYGVILISGHRLIRTVGMILDMLPIRVGNHSIDSLATTDEKWFPLLV